PPAFGPSAKRLEEVREISFAAEVSRKITTFPLRRRSLMSLVSLCLPGLFKFFRVLPVFSVLVVFFSLFRIAQYFVCLVDLLKSFVRLLIIRVQVGMIFARQFPVGFLDVLR